MVLDLIKCLKAMAEKNASDLHLKAGVPPIARKNNTLTLLFNKHPVVTHQDIKTAISRILNPCHQETLEEDKQLDFSYGIPDLGRFRFNIFYQRGTLRVVVRNIPFKIPDFESLSLPKNIQKIIDTTNRGLILVTGAAGNGKSSTMAAILNHINQTQNRHIITIEDPIEFLIQDRKSLITQRELGVDYVNYEMALKSSLRQDPDYIFFGELRDEVSAETALNAANTGHLVFSTLHTINAAETINRVLGMFKKIKQKHVRLEFASSLKAIICQRLVVRKDKSGLLPAVEILINNPRIRDILEDESKSSSLVYEAIETSKEVWNMQSFNQHLIELYEGGLISQKEAIKASHSPEKLRLYFGGLSHSAKTNTAASISSADRQLPVESAASRPKQRRKKLSSLASAQPKKAPKLTMEDGFDEMKTVIGRVKGV